MGSNEPTTAQGNAFCTKAYGYGKPAAKPVFRQHGPENMEDSNGNPPDEFPETVPQSGKNSGRYVYREADFWTCGFFPGSLYCILERSVKYPEHFLADGNQGRVSVQSCQLLKQSLLGVCRDWAQPLHQMAYRTDMHDVGFIVEPALRRDYELTGNIQSLNSILTAAKSLASRYNDKAKAICSWDQMVNNRLNFTTKDSGFLVIIDSMCNLDLLFYAGHHFKLQRLIDIGTTHAHTIRSTHLRQVPNCEGALYTQYSTYHLANLCPHTGKVLQKLTVQGYSDESTWSRGQAWGILGYAQSYNWTKDPILLSTACGLAEYFIARMESAPACVEVEQQDGSKTGRYVPLWDFDAPVDEKDPLRDSSAGMIAANGMLLLHGALTATGDVKGAAKFLRYAVLIAKHTLDLCFATDQLKLSIQTDKDDKTKAVAESADASAPSFEALLRRATANFNGNFPDRYSNHGLVYADYYFLEFGNRLLQAGLC
ncbi:Six-hairpin glycosidase [Metarhizium guizhouense ARSEF 977]|uniref:Six-hairpin glycosidase n=1 Tax=Metarhizium guizhouense (strain ARSEF 977) TaxID=1276136 RepID=A0A0B4G4D0_METGA|nr:Six-hairpin glycosidase [Metarhizium guizhouense ARSEF 977]